jgi:hypothetical protein
MERELEPAKNSQLQTQAAAGADLHLLLMFQLVACCVICLNCRAMDDDEVASAAMCMSSCQMADCMLC